MPRTLLWGELNKKSTESQQSIFIIKVSLFGGLQLHQLSILTLWTEV